MNDIISESVFFGVLLSLSAYWAGLWLRRKTGWSMMNPLLVSIVIVVCVLLFTGTEYENFKKGTELISYLLTPATVCLAVPLYQQLELLKRNWKAVTAGILSGVLSSMLCILAFALIFRFDHQTYVTFLPKSITTAIGIGVSEELGGYISISVVSIVITGIIGNIFAEKFLKLLKINEPIAKGIAIGSSSHAIGTTKAMEMGAVEGAMGSLSIVVSGIMTVFLAPVFAPLIS